MSQGRAGASKCLHGFVSKTRLLVSSCPSTSRVRFDTLSWEGIEGTGLRPAKASLPLWMFF